LYKKLREGFDDFKELDLEGYIIKWDKEWKVISKINIFSELVKLSLLIDEALMLKEKDEISKFEKTKELVIKKSNVIEKLLEKTGEEIKEVESIIKSVGDLFAPDTEINREQIYEGIRDFRIRWLGS
jgi:uncharacterized Rmd1/YagE family protein